MVTMRKPVVIALCVLTLCSCSTTTPPNSTYPVPDSVFENNSPTPPVSEAEALFIRAQDPNLAPDAGLELLFESHYLGHVPATTALGRMYLSSERKSLRSEGVELLEHASNQGDAEAMTALGANYYLGNHIPKDLSMSKHYFELAAAEYYPAAEFFLAMYFLHNNGSASDQKRAITLLKNASARGYADASKSLGDIYYSGQGVLRNNQTATRYYKHAGLRGSVEAQYNAGYLMVTTSDSFIDGMAWIEIAAHHGHEKAKLLLKKTQDSASYYKVSDTIQNNAAYILEQMVELRDSEI